MTTSTITYNPEYIIKCLEYPEVRERIINEVMNSIRYRSDFQKIILEAMKEQIKREKGII